MQLIDRALNALEILSQNMNGMSVTDLAEQLGIPASSTHRILSSLKGNHFVVQDEHTKKYRLGYKICAIATGVVKGSALTQAAQMPMRRLAEKIDRNVVLCIMEHGAVMNVACSERGDSNMYMVKIGHEIPFYSTSPSTYLPYWLSEYSSILTTYPSVRPLASASASAFVRARSTAFFNASAYASSYPLE